MKRRFASVRGVRRSDCGPAALATVARQHGLHVSVSRVTDLVGADAQGSELEQLRGAAEQLGFRASCGRAKPDALDGMPLPAIVHFEDSPQGHFVVVHEVKAAHITIADPERGIVRLSRDEFVSRWTRSVVS